MYTLIFWSSVFYIIFGALCWQHVLEWGLVSSSAEGLDRITSIHGGPLTFMLMMGYSEQRIDEWGE